jgi:PIN like domain
MKSLFPGYYRPTEEEFHQMWQECIFAFDANMLLNIYRYPSDTLETFFNILERLKERIWIPHQVATEFYENREVVIAFQLNMYEEIEKRFNETYVKLTNQLEAFKRHFSIKPEQLLELIQSGIREAKESLKNDKENYPIGMSSSDPLRDRLVELFESNVGQPFDSKRLSEIHLEAEQRFKMNQPPGYKDAKNKPIPERFGDVVAWFQLIEYAKIKQKSVIFVTNEKKEDWWLKKDGATVSPRPELANEIQAKAGVKFYMYQGEQFIKYAQEFLNLEDDQAAVQEVEEIGKQDEAYQREIGYSASQSRINLKAFESARFFENSVIRQAVEAVRAFDDPLVRQAIEQARKFNDPMIRQAIEQARRFDNPLLRHVIESTRSFDNSLIRQVMETARSVDSMGMRQAIEATKLWPRNHLSGQSVPRSISIDISPKQSSDLPNADESKTVKVEVLLKRERYGSPEGETLGSVAALEARAKTPPYEFNNFPFTVNIIHRANTSHPRNTSHRLRKPTLDEWEEWSLNIECIRRHLSPAEIDEHNAHKGEDEKKETEIWAAFYGEWEASKHLYNKIILEIAGVRLDKHDEFPTDQFRELAPNIIDKLRFGTKEIVITGLYGCWCGLEKPVSLDGTEQRIYQNLSYNSSSYDVFHTLRKPTEAESYAFRTSIVKGYFSTNEDNQEIIQLKLNLSTAIEFYNELIINIENATVDGKLFSDKTRSVFLEAINPVHKLRVLEPLFDVNAWYFKIDEIPL